MDNSIFYKSVECIVTNEGKNLFAKQANGVKFSKVGAVLFSDLRGTINDAYNRGQSTNNSFLKNLTLKQLKNYTTLIYKNISYTMEGSVFIPDDTNEYNNALNNPNNLIPIQLAYGNRPNVEVDEDGFEETTYTKYMSYDLVLQTNLLSVTRAKMSDMNFDGYAILGLPFKTLSPEHTLNIIQPQDYAIIAIVYFPENKLQVLHNQSSNVAMNVEMHVYMDEPINLTGLKYVNGKGLASKNPIRFINGLHLTNDGLHDKG